MLSATHRLTGVLVIAAVGLAPGVAGRSAMTVPRCRPESANAACSPATAETEVPQPTATLHVHVSFRGTVWDGTEGVALAGARVVIAACANYSYEETTDADGRYHSWLGTENGFACGTVRYQVSAEDHATARRTVRYHRYLSEDFVLKRIAESMLLLPVVVSDHSLVVLDDPDGVPLPDTRQSE